MKTFLYEDGVGMQRMLTASDIHGDIDMSSKSRNKVAGIGYAL